MGGFAIKLIFFGLFIKSIEISKRNIVLDFVAFQSLVFFQSLFFNCLVNPNERRL